MTIKIGNIYQMLTTKTKRFRVVYIDKERIGFNMAYQQGNNIYKDDTTFEIIYESIVAWKTDLLNGKMFLVSEEKVIDNTFNRYRAIIND